MSKIISNTFSVNYDKNNIISNQSTDTSIEMPLTIKKIASTDIKGYIDDKGLVGNDRYIIYKLTLINFSSFECKINSIIDTINIEFPSNYTPNYLDKITISNVIPENINLEVEKDNKNYSLYHINLSNPNGLFIKPNSEITLCYTVNFSEITPVNSIIKNYSKVNYNYSNKNKSNIFSQENTSNSVFVSLIDGNESLVLNKKSPDFAFYGEEYSYILYVENISESSIDLNEITDTIDNDFKVNKSNIKVMLDSQVISSSMYSSVQENNPKDLNNIIKIKFKSPISINKNSTLSITIPGKVDNL